MFSGLYFIASSSWTTTYESLSPSISNFPDTSNVFQQSEYFQRET